MVVAYFVLRSDIHLKGLNELRKPQSTLPVQKYICESINCSLEITSVAACETLQGHWNVFNTIFYCVLMLILTDSDCHECCVLGLDTVQYNRNPLKIRRKFSRHFLWQKIV
jgi:hypothetical protein